MADIKAMFFVQGEEGAMVPLTAYGHSEIDGNETYFIVDHIVDCTGYRIGGPRGLHTSHPWSAEAYRALEVAYAKLALEANMTYGEGKF